MKRSTLLLCKVQNRLMGECKVAVKLYFLSFVRSLSFLSPFQPDDFQHCRVLSVMLDF
jgi:hypothetical protein